MARNPEAIRAAKARYRERHREELRAKNREYAARKAREAGVTEMGSPEWRERCRLAARPLTGERHPNWKGADVGYFALHAWVNRHKNKTGVCESCGSRPSPPKGRKSGTEWANVSGEYVRDLADWQELCIPCHRNKDMTEEMRERLRAMAHIGGKTRVAKRKVSTSQS